MKRLIILYWFITVCLLLPKDAHAGKHKLTVSENQILCNEEPVKLIGLRCSNALISDIATNDLIASLEVYKSFGLNTISVYLMGSRFGDVKGFFADGSLNPVYRDRLERIVKSAEKLEMIVLVGCLYWGTSKAKEDLELWNQHDANTAITNTASWLKEKKFELVMLDPDNEGMAVREKGWKIESLIAAAKEAHPDLLVANNTKQNPPNEDLNLHFGNKEAGKPYIDSESTPNLITTEGRYWGSYSKVTHQSDKSYYNYSRIGRYTIEMKEHQINKTIHEVQQYNGILLASTWIQCGPAEGINGPFSKPGGHSNLGSAKDADAAWNAGIDKLHPDAGVLWWMEFVRDTYGSWKGFQKGSE
jgi:hypothetical protein